MAGEIASLLISRMAVPVLYFMAYDRHPSEGRAPRTGVQLRNEQNFRGGYN